MSIFKIPISICKAIEKRIACFWWKQTVDRKGIHWKSWESLRTRKDTGGLGFRDLVSFNKAMLGRQAWRLVQDPNSLWTKVVKGIYYPQGEFWRAGKGSRPSWGWQSLLIGREAIESETRWLVGDGKQIRIREDVWLPRGRIGGGANLNEPTTVAELIVPEEKEWDVAKLKEMFDEQVINEILSIPLSSNSSMDRIAWMGNNVGSYSVKSGYNKICSQKKQLKENQPSSSYQPPRGLWTTIWQTPHYPKVKFFLWSVCNNALPTRENLYRRKMLPDPLYPICHEAPETLKHLLLLCPTNKR